MRALDFEGYKEPTPIQAQAIPVMREGHDILGIAQTGTGKTAAFVLPMLDALIAHRKDFKPHAKGCFGLIIAPTRELAAQIEKSIRDYGHHTRPNVALIVGGVRPFPQIKQMSKGVDIVVATPGRLLDHLERGVIQLNATVQVVLDEADQMMDMGFIPAIRKIMRALPRASQTVLFSATMPKQVAALAEDFLSEPKRISVAPQSQPIERIDQQFLQVEGREKRKTILNVLEQAKGQRVIIFTRTKRGADNLEGFLKNADHKVLTIHGDKNQRQRDRALLAFRKGRTDLLIATDIAARGIDIDDIALVINYELPTVAEAYVHRIGRTARAGKKGVAISLCEPKEHKLLYAIAKLTGQKVPFLSPERSGKGGQEDRPRKTRWRPDASAKKRSFRSQGAAKPALKGKKKNKPKRKSA